MKAGGLALGAADAAKKTEQAKDAAKFAEEATLGMVERLLMQQKSCQSYR